MRGMVRWIFRREELEPMYIVHGRKTSVYWPQMNISCCSFLLSAPTTLERGRLLSLLSVYRGRRIKFDCKATSMNISDSRGLPGCLREWYGGHTTEDVAQVRYWRHRGGERVLLIFNLRSCHYWLKDECWGYKKLRLPPHLWGIWGLMSNPQ